MINKCAYRILADYLESNNQELLEYMQKGKYCKDCSGVNTGRSCFRNIEDLIKLNEEVSK